MTDGTRRDLEKTVKADLYNAPAFEALLAIAPKTGDTEFVYNALRASVKNAEDHLLTTLKERITGLANAVLQPFPELIFVDEHATNADERLVTRRGISYEGEPAAAYVLEPNGIFLYSSLPVPEEDVLEYRRQHGLFVPEWATPVPRAINVLRLRHRLETINLNELLPQAEILLRTIRDYEQNRTQLDWVRARSSWFTVARF